MDITDRLNRAIARAEEEKDPRKKGLAIHKAAIEFDLDRTFLAKEMSKRGMAAKAAKKRAAAVSRQEKKPHMSLPPEHWLDIEEREQIAREELRWTEQGS